MFVTIVTFLKLQLTTRLQDIDEIGIIFVTAVFTEHNSLRHGLYLELQTK